MNVVIVNRRTAGRVEAGTIRVYIGRPSKYGNEFVIGRDGTRSDVIRKYEETVDRGIVKDLVELAKDGERLELECWCSPAPCHGNVLKKWIEEGLEDAA